MSALHAEMTLRTFGPVPSSAGPLYFRRPFQSSSASRFTAGASGVLELHQSLATGDTARAQPLRDDALKFHGAGVLEDEVAGMGPVLVKAQARQASAQQARTGRLARLDASSAGPIPKPFDGLPGISLRFGSGLGTSTVVLGMALSGPLLRRALEGGVVRGPFLCRGFRCRQVLRCYRGQCRFR
jgi:hypothetical protein